MRTLAVRCVVVACILAFGYPLLAQRHARKEAAIEESGKARGVTGGVKVSIAKAYDDVYQRTLNYLKKSDYAIESADKETGQIVTEMTITGGYSQTGRRVYAIFIKDTDSSTIVRVAVTDQKRKKLLQTEPWSDPKVNEKETERIAELLKSELDKS